MQHAPPAAPVRELLRNNRLPTDDLTDEHLAHFFALVAGHVMVGVVGLEIHGTDGLLRSLVVSEDQRGSGAGKKLVDRIEVYAKDAGITHMYLLTETAEHFFQQRGYARIERDRVPATIRATREFASLCPASAAVMVKPL